MLEFLSQAPLYELQDDVALDYAPGLSSPEGLQEVEQQVVELAGKSHAIVEQNCSISKNENWVPQEKQKAQLRQQVLTIAKNIQAMVPEDIKLAHSNQISVGSKQDRYLSSLREEVALLEEKIRQELDNLVLEWLREGRSTGPDADALLARVRRNSE